MATNTVIESLGVYFPAGRLTTKELVDGCRVKPAVDIEELTGIKERACAGDEAGEYSIDLAIKAVEKCLEISRYSAEDMDMVICANICRFNGSHFKVNYEPSTAVQLAKHFNFKNATTFDVSNACAGMFTAVNVMDAFIKAGVVKRGMVVSGEYITHLAINAQKEITNSVDPQFASLTVGDSGTAVILETSERPGLGFHEMELFTVAEYCDLCIGKPSEKGNEGYVMETDSSKIHAIAIGLTSEHIGRAVKGTNWEKASYHHYIMHQTATRAITTTMQLINNWTGSDVCTMENTVFNVANRGNTASTAHFVALWDHIKNGAIRSGDHILFGVQASGINLGVAKYTLDDLPERIMAAEGQRQEENVAQAAYA